MSSLSLALLVLLGICLVVVAGVALRQRRLSRRLERAQSQIEALSDNFNALCAGAAGVDQRLLQVEQQGRDLAKRQENLDERQRGGQPYGEAIQKVHQGATAEQLVEEFGLSQSEAELVVMLHGMKSAM